MKTIDARGLNCPQPVLLTKQAADKGETEITVLVDNPTAKANISRFAKKSGYAMASSAEGGDTIIPLRK